MKSEAEAIQAEAAAVLESAAECRQRLKILRGRMEALKNRPVVYGSGAEAIRKAALADIESELAALDSRDSQLGEETEALEQRSKHFAARVEARWAQLDQWPGRRQWAWGTLLGALVPAGVAASWTLWYGGGTARLPYFELAAQVIPVLVLAVAIEGRQFNLNSRVPAVVKAYSVLNLLWLAAGEAAAMYVLAVGDASDIAFGLTTAALVSAGTLLVSTAIFGESRAQA